MSEALVPAPVQALAEVYSMASKHARSSALKKYAILQLPGIFMVIVVLIVLERTISLPGWMPWLVVFLWIAKDAILFPFVWRAYDTSGSTYKEIVGMRGRVVKRLEPSGYVLVNGELWKAELEESTSTAEEGAFVEITQRKGLAVRVCLKPTSFREESS